MNLKSEVRQLRQQCHASEEREIAANERARVVEERSAAITMELAKSRAEVRGPMHSVSKLSSTTHVIVRALCMCVRTIFNYSNSMCRLGAIVHCTLIQTMQFEFLATGQCSCFLADVSQLLGRLGCDERQRNVRVGLWEPPCYAI